MLQIIGWLGCLYLFVKALELAGRREPNALTNSAAALAFIGAILFAYLINEQAKAVSQPLSDMPGITDTGDAQRLYDSYINQAENKRP